MMPKKTYNIINPEPKSFLNTMRKVLLLLLVKKICGGSVQNYECQFYRFVPLFFRFSCINFGEKNHESNPLDRFLPIDLHRKMLSLMFVCCLVQMLCHLMFLLKIQGGRQNGRQWTPWDNISRWEHQHFIDRHFEDSKNVT